MGSTPQKERVCRPPRLTCRWIQELTLAISILCPKVPPIQTCPTDLEHLWAQYWSRLSPECLAQKQVQQILQYEVDYHEILKR